MNGVNQQKTVKKKQQQHEPPPPQKKTTKKTKKKKKKKNNRYINKHKTCKHQWPFDKDNDSLESVVSPFLWCSLPNDV